MVKRRMVGPLGVVAALVLALGLTACGDQEDGDGSGGSAAERTHAPQPEDPNGAPCTYTASGEAARPVEQPATTAAYSGTVEVTIETNQGDLHATLDAAAAPCTVNSFTSLASQGFFDRTTCPRVTTAGIFVLQCGDPTGTTGGGPGYLFADELTGSETYPAGTLAMANAGAGTNGSQFFVVYGDTDLDPNYTVFGTIDEASVEIVAGIAADGTEDGSGDGTPKTPVEIDFVDVGEAVAGDPAAATTSAAADGTCVYTADGTGGSGADPVEAPPAEPTVAGTIRGTIVTNLGKLPITLDADKAPCAVGSFVSLAEQGFFDGAPCHRLTTEGILVLQCGDPTGGGGGGPGYTFGDELTGTETYPAGTLALANSGPDTNGSQFFIVYGDSDLDPLYTVIGQVSPAGIKLVTRAARAGVQGGGPDGAPKKAVTFSRVTVRP
ncbi:peptidylprolyl isomerase [Nocardioides sp.]|uniref:peptidylprolyl isomerase n=1 Tax=Nocardioides sp. TaxID=35761 RepID=UPI0027263E73|nr:peptidylprolyl isomerase [Nocardioides sp.]MDO9454823.1 peptidylprolyl isomerase [Nocardioides sp.]